MERTVCGLREVKFASDKASDMTFSGYGAVFGNVDAYGDTISPGAFADTLSKHAKAGSAPAMLLQHGGSFMGSAMDMTPVGIWTSLSEDGTGLKVEGKLADTARGREMYALLKMTPRPAIDGLSIGYKAIEWAMRSNPEEPRRTLKKVDLFEVSLVTFPANTEARISQVKSIPETIREFEDFLRDVGGFSIAQAKAVASRGFKGFADLRDADAEAVDLAKTLRKARERLTGVA